MLNEVLQWSLLVVLGVLLLGVLHQVAGSLPPPAHTTSGPPLGRRAPRELLSQIRGTDPNQDLRDGTLVAFVVEDCAGCQQLLADLGPLEGGRDQHVVLVAKRASPQFREALMELGRPTIFDEGALWELCHVTNTPLVLRVDAGGRVVAKEVTHHVDAVASSP